jgi:hypothetical protein
VRRDGIQAVADAVLLGGGRARCFGVAAIERNMTDADPLFRQ